MRGLFVDAFRKHGRAVCGFCISHIGNTDEVVTERVIEKGQKP